ncbi:hypothetical protein TPENAI_20358 [Tenacibaculum litopenaei]|uniref:hypothetical protein n=1 Tax=Tenacibaculum litopenaei TaxID=396016 RepID=UPI0038941775
MNKLGDYIDETYKRVEKIIVSNHLNVKSFEEKVQVSNNSIGTAIRRKSSFKSNVLNKILIAFPEINPTWLLTGKGEMHLFSGLKNPINETNSKFQTLRLKSEIKTQLMDLLATDSEIHEVLESQMVYLTKKSAEAEE